MNSAYVEQFDEMKKIPNQYGGLNLYGTLNFTGNMQSVEHEDTCYDLEQTFDSLPA